MHITSFRTSSPVGAVTRALDELDRAAFTLRALEVAADEREAWIRIGFDGQGTVSAQTFMDRLARMPGMVPVDGWTPADATRERT